MLLLSTGVLASCDLPTGSGSEPRTIVISPTSVTLDAIGCQKEIAAQIVDQGGAYVITVKANQTRLHDDIDHFYQACLQERGELLLTELGKVREVRGFAAQRGNQYARNPLPIPIP